MNTTLYFLFLQYFFAANAQATRQLLRLRNATSNSLPICAKLTPDTYQTKSVSRFTAYLQSALGQAVFGACQRGNTCENLCASYASFKIVNTKCQCLATVASSTVTPPKCGANAELSSDQKACQCAAGYEGDPVSGCTETAVVVMCANPYGNPCGPNSACTDTPNGISCTPTNLEGCPGGCGPNSTCRNSSGSGYQCDCNLGFYRKQPYSPCEAAP